jgi:hypothetical protein
MKGINIPSKAGIAYQQSQARSTAFKASKDLNSILGKINKGGKLTSAEIKRINQISKNSKQIFDSRYVPKDTYATELNRAKQLSKTKDFSKEALQKLIKEEKRQAKLNQPTKTPTIGEVKGGTEDYLDQINKIQKSEAKRYQSLLDKQTASFDKQLKSQSNLLNKQLGQLTAQSKAQTTNYENLIAGITSKQESELQSMRDMFSRQNMESESVISSLQADIDRLSAGNAPPVIDVDTSPALIGVNRFQEHSRQRQMLGTRGARQARPQTGALGLAIGA